MRILILILSLYCTSAWSATNAVINKASINKAHITQAYNFPSTGVLDNFNRADGALGANWQSITGMAISSNAVLPSVNNGTSGATWNATFGTDEEAYMTISNKGTVGDAQVMVRQSTANSSGYVFEPDIQTANSPNSSILLYDGVNEYVLCTAKANITWATGDMLGISAIGTSLTAWRKPSGGSWTVLCTANDSTYSGASPNNNISMASYNGGGTPSIKFDDFGGGTFVHQ